MPIYEYACAKCESEFEVEQRITDDPIKTCPKCRSRRVKKLISRTSFVLKGSGWYSDLYSSSGSPNEKSEGKGDGGDTGSSESGKDSKKSDDSGSKDKKSKKDGKKKGSSKAAA